MQKERLSYCEAARRYNISDKIAATWERIYLEEGLEGLFVERQGRANSAGGVRKGRPPNLDNAVMENFFGLLKSELLYLQKFDSIGHFKAGLDQYLDYYNNHRIKAKLNGLTPAAHRYQAISVA